MPLLANGQAQLLPAGEFAARDGRPGNGAKWAVSDAQGVQLAAAMNLVATQTPIVIDYEHQTMLAAKNGLPAPAAGWITRVEWRAGQGMFADVAWTDKAKAHIDAGEYRFISPVIEYDAASNAVHSVLNAALVNYPAVLGMEPVMASLSAWFSDSPSSTSTSEQDMTLLAALIAAFGLQATATEADAIAALNAFKARPPVPTALSTALGLKADATHEAALSAVATLKTAAEKPVLSAALVTALGLQAGADEAAALAAVTTLKSAKTGTDEGTLTAMQALQTQVATLSGQINERNVNELVDGAITAHKLLPAQRDWAIGLGKTNLAALQGYLGTAQVIPGLGGQSGGKAPGDVDTAALSGLANDVILQFGLSAEQFAKAAPKTATTV